MLKKSLLLLFTLFFIATLAQARQISGYDLKKGDTFTITSDFDQDITQSIMGQQMEIKQLISTSEKLEVLDVKDGIFTLSSTNIFTKQTISSPMGSQTMDSNGNTQFDAPFKVLKGKTYQFTMNKYGEVLEIMGINELRATIEKEIAGTPLAANLEQLMDTFKEENLKSNLLIRYEIYPTTKVEQWTKQKSISLNNMPVDLNSEYLFIGDDQIMVNSELSISGKGAFNGMQLDMDLSGTNEGMYNLNSETGMSDTSEVTSNLEGSVEAQGMSIPMTILSVTTTTITKN